MNKKLPKLILVIGNPCVGKSSFIEEAIKQEGHFKTVNDFTPLSSVFRGETLIHECIDKDNFSELWGKFISTIPYAHLFWGADCLPSKEHKYAVPNKNGGHDIINPELWDMVLDVVSRELQPTDSYIFEFARGDDKSYLEKIGIDAADVYERSLGIILNNAPDFIDKSLIIYLSSDFDVRCRRNSERRDKGGHFVSAYTMDSVYRHELIDKDCSCLSIAGTNVPLYYSNVPDMDPVDREAWFAKIFRDSIEFYNKESKYA